MATYELLTLKAFANKVNAIKSGTYTPTNNYELMNYSLVSAIKKAAESTVTITIGNYINSSGNSETYSSKLLVLNSSVSAQAAPKEATCYEYSISMNASNITAADTEIPVDVVVKYKTHWSDGSVDSSWTTYNYAEPTITGTTVSKNETNSSKSYTVTASYYEEDSCSSSPVTVSKTITQAARTVSNSCYEYTISMLVNDVDYDVTAADYSVTAKRRLITTYNTGTVTTGSWANTTAYQVTGDTTFSKNTGSSSITRNLTATITATNYCSDSAPSFSTSFSQAASDTPYEYTITNNGATVLWEYTGGLDDTYKPIPSGSSRKIKYKLNQLSIAYYWEDKCELRFEGMPDEVSSAGALGIVTLNYLDLKAPSSTTTTINANSSTLKGSITLTPTYTINNNISIDSNDILLLLNSNSNASPTTSGYKEYRYIVPALLSDHSIARLLTIITSGGNCEISKEILLTAY